MWLQIDAPHPSFLHLTGWLSFLNSIHKSERLCHIFLEVDIYWKKKKKTSWKPKIIKEDSRTTTWQKGGWSPCAWLTLLLLIRDSEQTAVTISRFLLLITWVPIKSQPLMHSKKRIINVRKLFCCERHEARCSIFKGFGCGTDGFILSSGGIK